MHVTLLGNPYKRKVEGLRHRGTQQRKGHMKTEVGWSYAAFSQGLPELQKLEEPRKEFPLEPAGEAWPATQILTSGFKNYNSCCSKPSNLLQSVMAATRN